MGLAAVGLVSQDLQKAANFYRQLGLSFQPLGGNDHWEAVTEQGLRVMLDSANLAQQLNPNWQPNRGAGPVLCFEQANPMAVDALHQALVQAGGRNVTPPWDAFWGQRYASLLDLDGNQIDLFAPLPKPHSTAG